MKIRQFSWKQAVTSCTLQQVCSLWETPKKQQQFACMLSKCTFRIIVLRLTHVSIVSYSSVKITLCKHYTYNMCLQHTQHCTICSQENNYTYSQFFQCKVHDSKCSDHLNTYRTITSIKARRIVRIALFLGSHLRVKLLMDVLSLQEMKFLHPQKMLHRGSIYLGVGGGEDSPPKHTNFPTEL